MRLILSTSNIIGGHSPGLARFTARSNAELTAALRANISAHQAALSHAPQDACTQDLYIPTPLQPTPLAEDRSAYEITVKLFHLSHAPIAQRAKHVRDAVEFVLKQLQVQNVDLCIISFPNITFDADDESTDESPASLSDCEQQQRGEAQADQECDQDDPLFATGILPSYRALEALSAGPAPLVSRLGLSEFGPTRLTTLLGAAHVRPAVDQINLRDCCVVPAPLILLARREGIELLTHNDCTDILPEGTLRELLGPKGAGLLAAAGGTSEGNGKGLKGDVVPLWVVKYTAVVKNRGVVENKGYFAVAELVEENQ